MKMKKWWLSFAVIFNVLSSSGQQTFKEVVRTPDHLGGILSFCIDYTCSFHVDNCCAPAVPNPVTCDSLTIETGGFCTKFKRWCCNGILKKLDFVLYDCGRMDNAILTDTFILNYLGGEINKADSYDILSDPNNPCALTEHQRRLILDVFLRTQGINPCLNIQE